MKSLEELDSIIFLAEGLRTRLDKPKTIYKTKEKKRIVKSLIGKRPLISENLEFIPTMLNIPPPLSNIDELLADDKWPLAVPDNLLCKNEKEKRDKASSIISCIINVPLAKKKLLDFGCGNNFIVREARRRDAVAFGYDIKEVTGEHIFRDFDEVKKNGPYDIILVYDVLDHLVDLNIQNAMNKIRELCNNNTQIFITTHPMHSRHGAHLHPDVNKAFVHLFKNNIEPNWFKDFGFYQSRFSKSGFCITNQIVRSDRLEKYFLENPVLLKHLEKISISLDCSLPQLIWKMRNSFFDFVLSVGNCSQTIPYPVATINHTVGVTDHFYHTLYSNGKINNPKGQDVWSLNGKKLVFEWPRKNAPDGSWKDECFLHGDLQSYTGENQLGLSVHGGLV